MSAMKNIFLLIFCLWILQPVFAWDFPNENRIYDPQIHTVLLHKDGFAMADPLIALNSAEQLLLSFDDLNVSLKDYRFTIRHCTSDWQTSDDLMVADYIDGIREENIEDFDYSYNTTIEYIHYSTVFPTSFMAPRISGNYLLIVYTENPENPSFTRRFMVVEPTSVAISARIIQADDPGLSFSHQQVDFKVGLPGFLISNPREEIDIVITQNGRWDNAIVDPEPRFVRANELDFTFDPTMVFTGGNEFRALDIKSLQYQSERIRHIDWDYAYHVYMLEDLSRARRPYVLEDDINGRMVIENDQYAQNSAIEADYAYVHFAIPSSQVIPGGKLYLMGALTDYRLAPPYEMAYDPETRRYNCQLYLKQGYYDYCYVFKPDRADVGDAAFFEGSHWETENQYAIYVYFRALSGLYDRLVAVQYLNSTGQ
jgi:hypothetical protein